MHTPELRTAEGLNSAQEDIIYLLVSLTVAIAGARVAAELARKYGNTGLSCRLGARSLCKCKNNVTFGQFQFKKCAKAMRSVSYCSSGIYETIAPFASV